MKTLSVLGVGCVTIIGIILLAILGLGGSILGIYNGIQTKNQAVGAVWADVEAQYQRRYDLIPNLVQTVKAAATFEKSTFVEISEARASVGKVTIDPSNITQEQLEAYQKAQSGLAGALSKLMLIQERYPELKANTNFLSLQAELAGTENRITVKRGDFNATTMDYNTAIVTFPASFIASFFNFKTKPYFKSDEKAASAPVVDFGIK